METWYNAFKYFLIIFYEKMLSVRERNMKLLLKTVTYTAVKERVTCVITIGTVMCIINCRKYHLQNCNGDSHLHNYNKNCRPIFSAETVTYIGVAETFNYCIIATETVTHIIVIKRSTNILVTESTTSKPAKMQQMLSLA